MIKASVVLPVHRADEYFCLAADSCVSQLEDEYELIIVANGSSSVLHAVNNWLARIPSGIIRSRIKVLFSSSRGISNALSLALNSAAGTYIIRMDADDISLPGRFKCLVGLLDSSPDLMIISTTAIKISSTGALLGFMGVDFTRSISSLLLMIHSPIVHPTVAFRKSSILDVGGYSHAEFAEDYDLWLRVDRSYPNSIACFPLPHLYCYRVHQSQITAQHGYLLSEVHRKFLQVRELIIRPSLVRLSLLFAPRFMMSLVARVHRRWIDV